MSFTPDQLSSLEGKTFVITGGNSGLGFAAAKILTGKGAHVVITTRSQDKAERAKAEIEAVVPQAEISTP